MDNKFELSIILPAYNVENYIKKSIDSILTQEGINFEIIIVNDGSTDGTLAIIKENFGNLKNLKLITQSNQGSGIARNTGFNIASGEYVLFMDPDDSLLPNSLKNLFSKVKKIRPDLIIFGLKIYNVATQKINDLSFSLSEKSYENNAEVQEDLYTHHRQMTYTPPWNKLIRRDFLKKSGLQFTNQRTGQDVLFSIDLFNNVSTAFWDPTPYYLYSLGRKEGAAHKRNPKMVNDNVIIAKRLLKNAKDNGRQRIASEMIVSFGMRELRHCILKVNNFKTFKVYWKASPLNEYLNSVKFAKLPYMRKLQYLTRRNLLLSYLYFRKNL